MFGQIFGIIGDGLNAAKGAIDNAVAGVVANNITKTVESGNTQALTNPITAPSVLNPINAPVIDAVAPIAGSTASVIDGAGDVAGEIAKAFFNGFDTVKKYLPAVAVGAGALFLLSKR